MAGIIMLPVIYVAIYHIEKHFVKKEMEQKLHQQQLVTLQIPENSICWYQQNEEIMIDGTLFDVESISYANGLAIIRGLYDDTENDLDKQLSKAAGQSRTDSLNDLLVKILECFFIEKEKVGDIIFAVLSGSKTDFAHSHTTIINTQFITVPTPPPLS